MLSPLTGYPKRTVCLLMRPYGQLVAVVFWPSHYDHSMPGSCMGAALPGKTLLECLALCLSELLTPLLHSVPIPVLVCMGSDVCMGSKLELSRSQE